MIDFDYYYKGDTRVPAERMMLNEDDDLVLLDILCIFTFNNF
jgi:hypothetical protein